MAFLGLGPLDLRHEALELGIALFVRFLVLLTHPFFYQNETNLTRTGPHLRADSRRAANSDSTSADPVPILNRMVLMPYHHMFEFGAVAVLALILIARILMR